MLLLCKKKKSFANKNTNYFFPSKCFFLFCLKQFCLQTFVIESIQKPNYVKEFSFFFALPHNRKEKVLSIQWKQTNRNRSCVHLNCRLRPPSSNICIFDTQAKKNSQANTKEKEKLLKTLFFCMHKDKNSSNQQ